MGRWLSWLEHEVSDPGDRARILVTAITYSCAEIHFPAVYSVIKGQLLSYHAYMMWEVKDPLSRLNSRLVLSPSHLIDHITPMI